MDNSNLLPSQRAAVAGFVNPVSQAAGTVTTGWVAVKDFESFLAIITAGVLGASATLDAKIQQATSSGGANAKDVTGKAITQMVKATDDNKIAEINLRADELDVNGGFTFIRVSATVGTAASLIAVHLLGFDPHYGPASDNDSTSVKEIIA